jgi:hypothetical protein
MNQLIIGLGNKARHGKDSFAQAIENYFAALNTITIKHGLKTKPVVVQRVSFADALYEEVNAFLATLYGARWLKGVHNSQIGTNFILPEWVTSEPNPERSARAPYGKHPKLLQWWGTEYRRAQDPEYWARQWKAAINPKADIVLSTDMRFINEAWTVKSVGGVTVQVNRRNEDGTVFIDPARDANHVSETQLDGFNYDYKITVKTGDLALLDEWAITLVQYLRALKGSK